MSPRSVKRGVRTSAPEVTRISAQGFWLSLDGAEYFVRFAEFPFFRAAPVRSLFRVRRPSESHLRWPELDVDLELDSIREPARYPLVSKAAAARVQEAAPTTRRVRTRSTEQQGPREGSARRARRRPR
ncbi:MAG: DUF2442 domain-containing protein [Candidatus Eisenbacteria bacterium]|uniref:DUF2442 domain-containing protein n=1 Tax=Eiseniibacteriota bacterium TaxID=2212470 RepID=A0A933W8X5_UNCEI|nr:DUF2442 domain-containing protein [Candidatus Eisenbacteria bacterium]